MAAPTNAAKRKKALANTEPSTHGTSRQLLRRGAMSGVGGETDSITDGFDQTLLGNAEVYAWLNSRARSRQPSV